MNSLKIRTGEKVLLLVFTFAFLTGCVHVLSLRSPSLEQGQASWYGPGYHGNYTSSKEKYNMYDLTAAHQTLPFGTQVMVTNERNSKAVLVRINDRGPFIKGRIIDLSYGAARIIDMIGPGVVPVKLEILEGISPLDSASDCCVEAGTFVSKEKAVHLKSQLLDKYRKVGITTFKTPIQTYYIVRIDVRSINSARKVSNELYQKGLPTIILAKK